MIQAKAAESGNPLNAQAMSQLISALKSGNLDHNSAGMQQIKNLFSLQQQQKLGQASMNPAAAAAAMQAQGQGQGQGQGGGTDQLLLAAMRQQMLQQNQGQGQGQGQVNMGQNQQQQMQQQQQQQPQQRTQSGSQPQYPQQSQNQPQNQNQNQNHQQNQQQNRPNQVRVWSGSLIWNPNSTTRRKYPLLPPLAQLTPSRPEFRCERSWRKPIDRLQTRTMVQRSLDLDNNDMYIRRSTNLFSDRQSAFCYFHTSKSSFWG